MGRTQRVVPIQMAPERVSNYVKYRDTFSLEEIDFPMEIKNTPKFEKQNPTISVNIISTDSNNKGFCIEYLRPERNRQHHINLLLFADPDFMTSDYVHIKKL